MSHQQYVLKYVSTYTNKNTGEIEYFNEVVPIVEKDIETIHKKIKHGCEVFDTFTLWGHDFTSTELEQNGYNVITADEWFTNGVRK